MDRVLATADIEPRDRLAYWYDVASKALVRHECVIDCPSQFSADLSRASLGEIGIVSLASEGIRSTAVEKRMIAAETGSSLLLSVSLEGRATVSQDGNEVVAGTGDMMLIDTRRPYAARYAGSWKRLFFKVPVAAIDSRLKLGHAIEPRLVSSRQGLGRLTTDFILKISSRVRELQRHSKEQLSDQVVDLLALLLAQQSNTRVKALASADNIALLYLRAAIDSRLTDPALDAATAAGSAGMTLARANRLLRSEGTTVDGLIIARRLERCHRALADPLQNGRTVREIAYAWGFADASHFSRRFKDAYGCAPGEYRRQQAGLTRSSSIAAIFSR
jgi:AraC-like DNA-binding protein